MPDQQATMHLPAFLLGHARPSVAEAMADTAYAALDEATALGLRGDYQQAREICAAVIFETQPLIAACEDLLRTTLHALLAARGFGLLSRLVLATTGRTVKVVLLLQSNGPIAPPQRREEPRRTIYLLDPRWLDQLSPGDMHLRHLCDALIARSYDQRSLPDPAPVARDLEPV